MPRKIDAWGSPHRHYSQSVSERPLARSLRLEQAVKRVSPQCRATVERSVKLWNQKIRNQLTSEIGFQLKGRHVPIRIDDGLPALLPDLLGHDDTLVDLILNQSLLLGVVEGTRFMDSLWEDVKRIYGGKVGLASRPEIVRVGHTAQAWLDLAKRHDLVEALREINEDVLGAYFFHKPEIRIYWVAIGIFAALLSVPVEALTFVVLSHELAHAYTHLGADIDDFVWPTRRFAETDVAIVEGLAQFYTEVVCANLSSQMPRAQSTFDELLGKQHAIYSTHRDWVKKDDHNSGEIVRVSLVECRRSGKDMHRIEFADIVKQRRREITGNA